MERAIHLGCLRKYAAMLNHQGGTLITSLHYFTLLLEEVQRLEISDQYWSYVSLKLRQMEHQWQPSRPPSAASVRRRRDGITKLRRRNNADGVPAPDQNSSSTS